MLGSCVLCSATRSIRFHAPPQPLSCAANRFYSGNGRPELFVKVESSSSAAIVPKAALVGQDLPPPAERNRSCSAVQSMLHQRPFSASEQLSETLSICDRQRKNKLSARRSCPSSRTAGQRTVRAYPVGAQTRTIQIMDRKGPTPFSSDKAPFGTHISAT